MQVKAGSPRPTPPQLVMAESCRPRTNSQSAASLGKGTRVARCCFLLVARPSLSPSQWNAPCSSSAAIVPSRPTMPCAHPTVAVSGCLLRALRPAPQLAWRSHFVRRLPGFHWIGLIKSYVACALAAQQGSPPHSKQIRERMPPSGRARFPGAAFRTSSMLPAELQARCQRRRVPAEVARQLAIAAFLAAMTPVWRITSGRAHRLKTQTILMQRCSLHAWTIGAPWRRATRRGTTSNRA